MNGGIKRANKAILGVNLRKEDNAITHSKTGERSIFIQSCATGHQSGGGPKARTWSLHRNAKLTLQAAPKKRSILAGCVVYVNGYVGSELSNEQLKDIVEENGGRVKTMPSAQCTHIFVHQNLSASKIEKFLKCRTNKTRYVYPAWAIDSAKAGRRLGEANYASPVFSETQISVNAVYGTANDVRTLHPAAYESAADIPPTPPRPVSVKSRPQSPPPLHPSPTLPLNPAKFALLSRLHLRRRRVGGARSYHCLRRRSS
ncbi:hypothetical protein BCR35DRAFT_323995 [Leucosporidium creatinivorum]|uniref:BRCT domain-containing protein n=1 Tax=Leucosporidium creatinivorum TaxID=106004 RepID=A0A1Y2FY73_9BASI|nr:hypothetical protein BCR35DRAFT_323995 [Leucosporidium creatinivorum]